MSKTFSSSKTASFSNLKSKPFYFLANALFLTILFGLLLFSGCRAVSSFPGSELTDTPISTLTSRPTIPNTITPAPTKTSTPSPTTTPEISSNYPILSLNELDQRVRAFPGPTHYEGDKLIFEINLNQYVPVGEVPVALQIDDQSPFETTGEFKGSTLVFSFDTSGLTGSHELTISAQETDVTVNEIYSLVLLPASQRPEQEREAAWETKDIECCVLHYITNTAAARDIEWIAGVVQEAAEEFDQFPNVDITEKIDIFFIDRMWYNGAFGGAGELLIVYTDRYYGPSRGEDGLKILVRHELGHAVFPIFSYGEGLSVFLAGGHYKPEPIPKRAAAMVELHYLGRSSGPSFGYQHELQYLYQAAIVNYMIETYGWEALWAFVDADSQLPQATPEERDQVFQDTFGISKAEFDQNFYDWVTSHEAGEQEIDLELTVKLQDLRREYQKRFAPEPLFLLGYSEDSFAKPEYLPANIREANSAANIATELLISDAQQAVHDGRYDEAQRLIEALESVLASGKLENPIARQYGNIVFFLVEQGYEAVSIALGDDTAEVVVMNNPPTLEMLMLQKADGIWEK